MKKLMLSISFLLVTGILMSQKLTTTSAIVAFDATTEKDLLPKAENKTVIGSLDKTTGALAFEAAVNNFAFSSPLMQQHFNSARWLNSAAFPKFSFSGKLNKLNSVKFNKNGTYKTTVIGNLTVKGVTKSITAPVTITVQNGKVSGTSAFNIKLEDYGIAGQAQIASGKVAPIVKVIVSAGF